MPVRQPDRIDENMGHKRHPIALIYPSEYISRGILPATRQATWHRSRYSAPQTFTVTVRIKRRISHGRFVSNVTFVGGNADHSITINKNIDACTFLSKGYASRAQHNNLLNPIRLRISRLCQTQFALAFRAIILLCRQRPDVGKAPMSIMNAVMRTI